MIEATETNNEWKATADMLSKKIAEIYARKTPEAADQTLSLKDVASVALTYGIGSLSVKAFAAEIVEYATTIEAINKLRFPRPDSGINFFYEDSSIPTEDALDIIKERLCFEMCRRISLPFNLGLIIYKNDIDKEYADMKKDPEEAEVRNTEETDYVSILTNIENIDAYTDGCLIKFRDSTEPVQLKYIEDSHGNLAGTLVNDKFIIPVEIKHKHKRINTKE